MTHLFPYSTGNLFTTCNHPTDAQYIGCFTTCEHYFRKWFPWSLWSKKFI